MPPWKHDTTWEHQMRKDGFNIDDDVPRQPPRGSNTLFLFEGQTRRGDTEDPRAGPDSDFLWSLRSSSLPGFFFRCAWSLVTILVTISSSRFQPLKGPPWRDRDELVPIGHGYIQPTAAFKFSLHHLALWWPACSRSSPTQR